MRVRSPSVTLTLTTTVSPGWNSGILAPGNLAACSASSRSMMFMAKLLPCAGPWKRTGERFGALFSVEARHIMQRRPKVEGYSWSAGSRGSAGPTPKGRGLTRASMEGARLALLGLWRRRPSDRLRRPRAASQEGGGPVPGAGQGMTSTTRRVDGSTRTGTLSTTVYWYCVTPYWGGTG